MMRLNLWGYAKLIKEDIEWLEKIPRTLERDHIILVLKTSIAHEYPESVNMKPDPCEEHGEPYCDCDK